MLEILLTLAALTAVPSPQLSGADAERARVLERSLDSVYMLGIVRRSKTGPEAFEFVGTGWVIEDGKLATNAHVAESLLAKAHEGRLAARRSWSDREELRLSSAGIRIHPAYAPWNARLKRMVVRAEHDPAAARSMSFIPVADVAICAVESGTTAPPLPVADPAKVQPALSESIVYLGFPHENISGFPTPHAVPGHVTAKTDFFFQRTTWPESFLIHWCGPVVGGASGSPMLNRAGQVVGLISASENNLSMNGERTSFGFAYGQRIDLARELLRDDFAQVQALRDVDWSRRIASLLLPPDELLEQMALTRANADGVAALDASHTVSKRSVRVTQGAKASLEVKLEPGFRYGFLAAAHDGSDIDARIVNTRGGELLGEDVESDYFPVVWLGPLDEQLSLNFELDAAELLLGETDCTVHVYRYEPQLGAVAREDEGVFFSELLQLESNAGATHSWRFAVQPGASLMFSATSADGYDIDLLASLDDIPVASDETPDSVPLMIFDTSSAGILEVRLRLPRGMPTGALVSLSGLLFAGPKPRLLAQLEAGAEAREFSDAELGGMLDEALDPLWEVVGVPARTVFERILPLEGVRELEIELPPGFVGIVSALAPLGEDIDLQVELEDGLVLEDVEPDSNPIVVLEPASQPRTATARLLYLEPEARIPQVIVRFCVLEE